MTTTAVLSTGCINNLIGSHTKHPPTVQIIDHPVELLDHRNHFCVTISDGQLAMPVLVKMSSWNHPIRFRNVIQIVDGKVIEDYRTHRKIFVINNFTWVCDMDQVVGFPKMMNHSKQKDDSQQVIDLESAGVQYVTCMQTSPFHNSHFLFGTNEGKVRVRKIVNC